MKSRAAHWLGMFGLLACGYGLGVWHAQPSASAKAQQIAELPDSDTITKIKAANDAVFSAAADLRAANVYRSATVGANPYSVFVGGVDAVEDLRTARGVDPHTYAALYAGLATEEIAADLGFDAKGRLTYRDRPVQMYSIERLKKLYKKQQRILDVR